MTTGILTSNDELNKQCEELKSETAKLAKQIDQEKDHHARRYVFLIVQQNILYFTT